MVRWPFVILWRVTHFSKTAQPRTVPNTDTGKTYLLMTDERKCYFHSWSDNTAAAQGYARVLLASSTTTNQPRGGRTQWRCGKCSVILVRNRNAESDFFLLMVNWFNWFVWCLLLFQKHLYDQPNYKRCFFFITSCKNPKLQCQLDLSAAFTVVAFGFTRMSLGWDIENKNAMRTKTHRSWGWDIWEDDSVWRRWCGWAVKDPKWLCGCADCDCPCKRELK